MIITIRRRVASTIFSIYMCVFAGSAMAFDFGAALTQAVQQTLQQVVLGAGMENGTDRYGSDYRSFDLPQPDPAQCQSTCNSEAQCKAWTYTKPGFRGPNSRCYLKQSTPNPTPNANCISGLKQEQQPKNQVQQSTNAGQGQKGMEIDTNRRGSDYRGFELPQPDPSLMLSPKL